MATDEADLNLHFTFFGTFEYSKTRSFAGCRTQNSAGRGAATVQTLVLPGRICQPLALDSPPRKESKARKAAARLLEHKPDSLTAPLATETIKSVQRTAG